MSVSSVASTVAYRTQSPQAAAVNRPAQPSDTQRSGRPHHHGAGRTAAGAAATAPSTSSSSTANGSLLDTLV